MEIESSTRESKEDLIKELKGHDPNISLPDLEYVKITNGK